MSSGKTSMTGVEKAAFSRMFWMTKGQFDSGLPVPELSAMVLRAQSEGRMWSKEDSRTATKYLIEKLSALDVDDMFEPGTEAFASRNAILDELEMAEKFLNDGTPDLYNRVGPRKCLVDEDGFGFLAASGFDPYVNDRNLYYHPYQTQEALQAKRKLPDAPTEVGNGIVRLGCSFKEYCEAHNDDVYVRLFNKTTEEIAKAMGYGSDMEYLTTGYRQSAMHAFEMAERAGRHLGIDTRESIEFMDAAMKGYCEACRKDRLEGKPTNMKALGRMNQVAQTLNLYLLEYYGSHGCEGMHYDLDTREALISCVEESLYYNLDDRHASPGDFGSKMADSMGRSPESLCLNLQTMNNWVRHMQWNGSPDIYPEASAAKRCQFGLKDFIPKDNRGKAAFPYKFEEPARIAKETAKALYPTKDVKTVDQKSELSKALRSGSELAAHDGMQNEGMDIV